MPSGDGCKRCARKHRGQHKQVKGGGGAGDSLSRGETKSIGRESRLELIRTIKVHDPMVLLLEVKLPYDPVCPSVERERKKKKRERERRRKFQEVLLNQVTC